MEKIRAHKLLCDNVKRTQHIAYLNRFGHTKAVEIMKKEFEKAAQKEIYKKTCGKDYRRSELYEDAEL